MSKVMHEVGKEKGERIDSKVARLQIGLYTVPLLWRDIKDNLLLVLFYYDARCLFVQIGVKAA